MDKTINVFLSYSHQDEASKKKLLTHLTPLTETGRMVIWEDRQILAGSDWNHTIVQKLKKADVILFLISSDALASQYIHDVEMEKALARAVNQEAIIVPVILRPCIWQKLWIGRYQAVPKDGKAITSWDNEDEAYLDIAVSLDKLSASLSGAKSRITPLPGSREGQGKNDTKDMLQQNTIYRGKVKAKTFIGQVQNVTISQKNKK
ncbi:MAG: toll/interleukin-1 receptor domain-containing protein [Lewinellaceae bacterium]|nr:toll/interleukin-1 receptor domain-containing protein [Phaeodactylibacter sp.]MCB9038163.1 toll/interleukin-1 receptor domain-containing protein [Lewinellaceae bacterium]